MEKIIEIEAGKFVIRPYCDQDEDSVHKLWKAAFGQEMSSELWHWKYLKNPYHRQMMLCLDQNGMAVVSFSGIPYRANMNGKTAEMTQVMDVMSHPDYRKTGLFIKTVHAFFDFFGKDILFVYGFPGKYHFDIGKKYLDYQALPTPVSFLSADTSSLTDKMIPRQGRIKRITRADESFDHLWEQCQKDYPLSVIRNSDFVRWRFLNHPMKQYDIFAYQKDSNLDAYAVFEINDKKARMGDILSLPSESLISDFMTQTALALKDSGVDVIETWLPENHFITKLLISTGFINFPEPLGIISTVRNFENSPTSEWTSENLFYTMADADLF